jgi:hypothetical protein
VSYPSPQEYNEAVQNPRTAFCDPELQAGQVESNKLGLPFARSGGFASVYKLECGSRNFAVRCFKREVADQQQRYRLVSQHLKAVSLAYTVDFTFLEQGIRVKGVWYPILKMEWIQGEPLNAYIEKRLNTPRVLVELADRWVRMTHCLSRARIAHGDLQHGNVLVVGGDFRLIDYDGMYVPALNGQTSNEVGLPNYQHPKRTGFDFGPGLDNFSSWVIYISLLALSVEPQLWGKLQGGDDCLLFRKEDFERPDQSKAFRLLERSANQSLQLVATQFKSFVYLAPLQVPPLGGSLAPRPVSQTAAGPGWLSDHRRTPVAAPRTDPASVTPTQPVSVPVADASWIFDHKNIGLEDAPKLGFENSPLLERLVLAVSGGCLLLFVLFLLPKGAAISTIATGLWLASFLLLNGLLWMHRFRSEPGNLALADLRANVAKLSSELGRKQGEIRTVEQERQGLLSKFNQRTQRLEKELQECERNEKQALDAQQSQHAAALASIQQRRYQLESEEQAEVHKISHASARSVASLRQQLSKLAAAEADELRNSLHRKQSDHIDASLRLAKVSAASIPGIGSERTSRLISAGIQTAADVYYHRVVCVKGFGQALASAVVDWRRKIEARARATMIQALPSGEIAQVQFRFAQQRAPLQTAVEQAQSRACDDEALIRVQFNSRRASLDREERDANSSAAGQAPQIRAKYKLQADQLKAELAGLKPGVAGELKNLDARMVKIQPELARLSYERGRLRHEVEAASSQLRFPTYLKRIVFFAA